MKALVSLIALAGVIFGTLFLKGCFEKKQKAPIVQVINPLLDSVEYYKDLWGSEHARAEIEINNRETAIHLLGGLADSLKKRIRLRDAQLKDMVSIIAQDKGHFETPLQTVVVHDTIDGIASEQDIQGFEYHDDHLQENGYIYNDRVTVDYAMQLKFTTTSYWVRKHHFLGVHWGKKVYYLDAYCDNPNVSINGLKAIKIND